MKKIIVLALAASVSFAAAAAPALANDPYYCDNYARKKANHAANGGNVLAGTAIGAGAGALVGAIVGGHHSVGKGAIIGGVGGTVVGGVKTDQKWKKKYNNAYAQCMSW
ncbi:YMGG-like glycine zipper-containing protein [Aestuariivirga sp.]|uniref:YMGG-like glycine zipper-containing protein n=1 Tax=Aestuariivirga sp. TaxID=2650926 RepID=UPI0039E5B3C5